VAHWQNADFSKKVKILRAGSYRFIFKTVPKIALFYFAKLLLSQAIGPSIKSGETNFTEVT
jgi:hypothetical protein